jgi:hypothetical protein
VAGEDAGEGARMTDLRQEARGRPCQVRLPGICNGDDFSTVLAHVRLAGVTGMGQKAPDLLAAWCCAACHNEADRRTRELETDFVRLAFLEGVIRTQNLLYREGKVKW